MDEQRIREIVREELEKAVAATTAYPLGDSKHGILIDKNEKMSSPNSL